VKRGENREMSSEEEKINKFHQLIQAQKNCIFSYSSLSNDKRERSKSIKNARKTKKKYTRGL
jgi:hypothetical protein